MLKLLRDLFRPATDHLLSGWLFLKGLALVYAVAFASLAVQIEGLAGPDGILPFRRVLEGALLTAFDQERTRLDTLMTRATPSRYAQTR